MDKKYMERPPKFDKRQYNKEHYRQFQTTLKPELKDRIDSFCKEHNMTKPEFMQQAIELMEEKFTDKE